VAEYTLSQILFGLKNGWRWAREAQRLAKPVRADQMHGAYETTVGLVSLGMVGKAVCRLLKHFDVNVIAFDPFVPADTARELGVELVRSLDDVFRRAHVVSLHTPWLKETENLIRGRHFDLMQPYTTFINTARGAVVFEAEMIEALERRPDITAVLDVTHPEPPAEGSPLLTLPNVVWTPHIAGSVAGECRRMGQYMIQEIRRYLEGLPMTWEISREKAALLA
jgi:phosphoglycerate dehydrogenase-like enzyme